MNLVPLVKTVAGLVTSFGAGAVVGNAIKATTPVLNKKSAKILVTIGSVALAAAAGESAARYVEGSIQGLADTFYAGRRVGEAFSSARRVFQEATDEETEDVVEAEIVDDEVIVEGFVSNVSFEGGEYHQVPAEDDTQPRD